MVIPFPTNTRTQIEAIINEDGRPVTFYVVESVEACDVCSLGPISETSTDSFCPSCSGEYWLPTYSGWAVTAHVTWGKHDEKAWETGGMIDNGECSVKFMHTSSAEEIVHSSQYVIVDDRTMDISKIILRGVPEVNRIIVVLKERER
jgi:hypothetical protein